MYRNIWKAGPLGLATVLVLATASQAAELPTASNAWQTQQTGNTEIDRQNEGDAYGRFDEDGNRRNRRALEIEDITLRPANRTLRAGDELTVRATGTPRSQASFSIQGIAQTIPLEEVERGVYEGVYTVRRGDQESNARIAVSFRRGNAQPVTREAERRLNFGDAVASTPNRAGRVKGDFTGDGRPDVLWSNSASGANLIWAMNGGRKTREVPLRTSPGPNWRVGGTGDFDGDGREDIFWRNTANGRNLVWRLGRNNLPTAVEVQTEAVGSDWQVGGVADFSGDGRADILWHNDNGTNSLWLMNGARRLSSEILQPLSDRNWISAGVGDLNGDGQPDLLWRNRATGANSVWFMNGTQMASEAQLPPEADQRWQVGSVADYNGDGRADLLWRHGTTGEQSLWLMNGAQRLSIAQVNAWPDTNWQIAGPR